MYFDLLIQMQKILPAMITPIQSYQKQRLRWKIQAARQIYP
jgi:hypothetical protein